MNETAKFNAVADAIARTDWRSDAEKVGQLTEKWERTKADLSHAQEAHLQSEIDLYNAIKDRLPHKGTTTLDSGMKITTGFTEKWDGEYLDSIKWDGKVPFPFKAEWKPDAKALAYVRENLPDEWAKLREGLTLTPKKPAFSMK